jgi:hypothetical protein
MLCALSLPWFALAGPLAIFTVLLYEFRSFLPLFFPVSLPMAFFAIAMTWPAIALAGGYALAIWAFPLAPAFLGGRGSRGGSWMFLGHPAELPSLAGRALHAGRALAIGAATGIVGGVILPAIPIPMSAAYLQAWGWPAAASALLPVFSMIASAIILQPVAALATAIAVKRLPVIHGMFAAFVAANLLSFALAAHFALQSDHGRLHAAMLSLRFGYCAILLGGTAAALAGALAAAGVKAALGRMAERRLRLQCRSGLSAARRGWRRAVRPFCSPAER